MPDSSTIPPEQSVDQSPLHRPLHELTENDITQLTREDCRRYLKQKGMRRPSWNKSQAIQQVISLKKLLDTSSHHHLPPPVRKSVDAGLSRPAADKMTIKENNSRSFGYSGDLAPRTTTEDKESFPRTTDASEMSLGQMTIFYCGKVNVYDDVPAEEAQVIMHLAASPPHLPQDALYDGTMVVQSSAFQMQGVGDRTASRSNAVLLQPENPGSRKASVQRYLEKRKDRFKSKRKIETTSSAGLDICYNHQLANELNQDPNIGNACSLSQIRPPNTQASFSSPENHTNGSADLNGKIRD